MVAAGLGDDPLGDLALEHQAERRPPRRPGLAAEPAQQQRGADIVGQVGDDMGAFADRRDFVDLERVFLDQRELAGKVAVELGQCGQAAPVALDRDDLRAGVEQGAGQAAGAGADFVDGGAVERAGEGGDPGEQLPVEDEILAQRLARLQPVAGDDVAQWLGARHRHSGRRCIAAPARQA